MLTSLLIAINSPLLTRFVRNVVLQYYPQATIYSARRGHEGVAQVAHHRPQLVICDNVLPDLTGATFAKLMAGTAATKDIPIILCHRSGAAPTPNSFPSTAKIILLRKPFAPEFLISAIAEVFEGSEEIDESPSCDAPSDIEAPSSGGENKAPGLHLHLTDLGHDTSKPEQEAVSIGVPEETTLQPVEKPLPHDRAPEAPEQLPAESRSLRVAKPRARLNPTAIGATSSTSILFRGNTESFPLPSALAAIEDDHLTGVLRLYSGKRPTEVFFSDGRIVLASTQDTVRYAEEMAGTNGVLSAPGIGMAHEIQRSNGCPVFLTLAKEGALPLETAIDEARYQSVRLVARAWEGDRTPYEFERLPLLPDYLKDIPAVEESTYQWALAALRCLDNGNHRVRRKLEPEGVPAYTPEGYELIQKLQLTSGEASFASAVNNASSVEKLAKTVGMPVRQAMRELHKFMMLEIMDYWPPRVLAVDG